MASWSTFIRPDYNTRFVEHKQDGSAYYQSTTLPAIKLAIPKSPALQALPKNSLPVNPSPHPSTDPAIQAPLGGRSSPAFVDHHRSPVIEQREYLSPQDVKPQRFDFTQAQAKPTDAYSISRSSSQTSFDDGQHCACCSRRQGHARSNSYSSIASSRTSSSVNLSSMSPDLSSQSSTPHMDQKRTSTFGRTFKFLQRSNSLDVHGTRENRPGQDAAQKARKRSTSLATKKKQPAKKVIFEMVTEDDHWADE